MSYFDPPRRRRWPPALVVVAAVACLLMAGGGLGWQLRNRDAASPGRAGEDAPPDAISITVAPVVEPTLSPLPGVTPAISAAATHVVTPPDLAALQALALNLINQDRQAAGLSPVAWDVSASALAQNHAEDMLAGQFFSHWNRAGYGPDHRAALEAGMTNAVFENIHTYWRRFDDGRPAPIQDWRQRILDAHLGLMASPGHRANILDPAHTHVGIGIAYAPDIGELRLVQEFVNRYVVLDPLPAELPLGAEVEISGRLLDGASDPLINLAYEPFPQPMTLEQLATTSSYQSAAQFFSAPRTTVEGDRFRTRAILDFNGQSGLYHVWIFVTVQGERVQVASPIIVAD